MFHGKHIISPYISHILNYRFNSEKHYLTKYRLKMCYYSLQKKKIKKAQKTLTFFRGFCSN